MSVTGVLGAHRRIESILVPRNARLALGVYGIAFAICAAVHLVAAIPNHVPIMGTRDRGVRASIAVLDRGGPPLLGATVPYGSPGIAPKADYYPVGVSDDQGVYLYLPVLGVITGEHDPSVLLKWLFIGCFFLLFAVYPLLIYEFLGSTLAAVAAPIIVLHWFAFLRNTDLYWIAGWVVLLGLPLILTALVRPWGRGAIALLLGSAFVASFATSIRLHSGLPLVIAAVAVAAVRSRSWRERLLVVASIVVVSFSVNVGVFDTVRIARDQIVGVPFRSQYPSEHPTWHNAYIGLGYLPNKYGITWNDQVSADTVKRIDPNAGYLTPRYEHILRHQWFKLLKHDPGFVLGTLWTKFGVSIHQAIVRFNWLWLPLIALTALVGARRRRMRWLVGLSIPALVLTVLPPVVTVPFPSYETGWLSTVGLLWMMSLLWVIAAVPDIARWTWSRPWTAPSHTTARRDYAVASAALVAVFALTRPAVVHAREALARAARETSATSATTRDVRQWTFGPFLPSGWRALKTAKLTTASGGLALAVTTSLSKADYQTWSPSVNLAPGRYSISASVDVEYGGITVGALDLGTQHWLAQTSYGTGEPQAMVTNFSLSAATRVEIVLSNWAQSPHQSHWTISHVELQQVITR